MSRRQKANAGAQFSAAIRDITRGGAEIYERMFAMARDPLHPDHFRALAWLADRGFGKEPIVIESVQALTEVDLDQLSDAQLMKLESALKEIGAGEEDAELVDD